MTRVEDKHASPEQNKSLSKTPTLLRRNPNNMAISLARQVLRAGGGRHIVRVGKALVRGNKEAMSISSERTSVSWHACGTTVYDDSYLLGIQLNAGYSKRYLFVSDIFGVDLHGDVQKVVCDLYIASVVPPSTTGDFVFPTIQCSDEVGVPPLLTNQSTILVASFFADDASVLTGKQFSDLRNEPLFEQRKRLTRNIVAGVRRKLTPIVTV